MGDYGPTMTAVHSMYDPHAASQSSAMTTHSNIQGLMPSHHQSPYPPHQLPTMPPAQYPNYPTPSSTPVTSHPPLSDAQLKKDRDEIYG